MSTNLPPLDTADLRARGWTSCLLPSNVENFRERLLAFASRLGNPVATRAKSGLCDTLIPIQGSAANLNSLSRRYSVGEFPLHADTSHWSVPCRYIVLGCLSSGSARRKTVLLNIDRLPLSSQQFSLLRSAPVRVVNGRASFFSTILAANRKFIRYDAGCMKPVMSDSVRALNIFLRRHWLNYLETIDWFEGKVVVIDNWRLLHGRGPANGDDSDRVLLRISIR